MGRQRNTFQTPRAIDSKRTLRASQAAAGGQTTGLGIDTDNSGRVRAKIGDAFFFDSKGVPQLRVGNGLAVLPGSPKSIVAEVNAADVAAVHRAVAVETAARVADTATVTSAVVAAQADATAGIANAASAQGTANSAASDAASSKTITDTLAKQWRGTATLVAGTIAVTIAGLTSGGIPNGICLSVPGGTLGNNYRAVCTANTLTITSVVAAGTIQVLDTSTVFYTVSAS